MVYVSNLRAPRHDSGMGKMNRDFIWDSKEENQPGTQKNERAIGPPKGYRCGLGLALGSGYIYLGGIKHY